MPTEQNLNLFIGRSESVPKTVVSAVRRAMVDGTLPPGRRLTERELMERTGVGRTSIREALRELESMGLVEATENRGLRVTMFGREDVRQLYEVRDALEPAAAELFVERASELEVKQLVECMEPAPNDPEERLKGNFRFDELLIEGARNGLLQEIMSPLHVHIHSLRRLSLSVPGRQEAATEEYHELISAIQAREAGRAATAAHQHVRAAGKAALEALELLEQS